MNAPVITRKTKAELSHPAPEGERHQQIVKVASSLAWGGLNADAIFCQLRPMYASDVSDSEIAAVAQWATSKVPVKTTKTSRLNFRKSPCKQSPEDAIKSFLAGFTCTEADLIHASPWMPLEDWRYDSLILFAALFEETDRLNIVTVYSENKGKANPMGRGKTMPRDTWMRHITKHGAPSSRAGAWLRINPVNDLGISDENVTAYRHALLEFDSIPLPLQISILAKLPLPICAILTSGGRSVHAWVRVNAPSLENYRESVGEMLNVLKCFGADTANKNPSRLSRLAGVQRHIGANCDGCQSLLYLNPEANGNGTIL